MTSLTAYYSCADINISTNIPIYLYTYTFIRLKYNSYLTRCHEMSLGGELVPHSIQTCESDGMWSGELPFCRRIKCPHIRFLKGNYSDSSYSGYCGTTRTFQCYSGYLSIYRHISSLLNERTTYIRVCPFKKVFKAVA